MMNKLPSMLGLIAILALGACSTPNAPPNTSNTGVTRSNNPQYGVVQSIELVKQDNSGIVGSGIGVGTIVGAVVGGVVGNQVGGGRGKTAATVIGAAGGAYAGHELENRQQQKADAYKITVRMEDGAYQTLTQDTDTRLRVGDRVRIENGVLQRY